MSQAPRKDQGFALVVVIMILLLVTALAAEMIFTVRTGVQEARQAKQATISRGLAKAGINLGLFHLTDTPVQLTDEPPYIPGILTTTYLERGKIAFQTIPESGKINLNNIKRPLLNQFLDQFGYDDNDKQIFTDSLQDWQDADNLHRLNGAERDYYETLTPPYQPANGPFKDPAELVLVRGAKKLCEQINPSDFFTVYNPTGRLNFNALSREMLAVMTGYNEEQIDQYYTLKETGTRLGPSQGQLILGDQYSQWQPYLTYSKDKNRYYTITATGYAGLKPAYGEGDKEANINLKKHAGLTLKLLLSKNGASFRYLRWNEESSVD